MKIYLNYHFIRHASHMVPDSVNISEYIWNLKLPEDNNFRLLRLIFTIKPALINIIYSLWLI